MKRPLQKRPHTIIGPQYNSVFLKKKWNVYICTEISFYFTINWVVVFSQNWIFAHVTVPKCLPLMTYSMRKFPSQRHIENFFHCIWHNIYLAAETTHCCHLMKMRQKRNENNHGWIVVKVSNTYIHKRKQFVPTDIPAERRAHREKNLHCDRKPLNSMMFVTCLQEVIGRKTVYAPVKQAVAM